MAASNPNGNDPRNANHGVSPLWIVFVSLIGVGAVGAILVALIPDSAPVIMVVATFVVAAVSVVTHLLQPPG